MTTTVSTTSAAPWSSVVQIYATFSDGTSIFGSGVVVGRNDVLTAAHMVQDARLGVATSVQITPGLSGTTEPFGSFTAPPPSYLAGDAAGDGRIYASESAHDVAVIGTREAIGDATGMMAVDPGFTSGQVNITGYPGVYGGDRMVTDDGSARLNGDGTIDITRIETHPGNSGGPVWYQGAGGATVVGLVSTGSWALQIGGDYWDEVQQWMRDNDALLGATTPAPEPPTPPPSGAGPSLPGATFAATTGDDNILAARGNDLIALWDGNDTALGEAGNDTLYGNMGSDQLDGGLGADQLHAGKDNDTVRGGSGNDWLNGNLGDDTVYGGTGADTVQGGRDQDRLFGEGGHDDLFGDRGNDTLVGGSGYDRFVFTSDSGTDLITDFDPADDWIRVAPGINGTAITTIADVIARSSPIEGGLLIDLGAGNQVTLLGIGQLRPQDVLIGA